MLKEDKDNVREDEDDVLMAFAEARAAAPDDKTLLRHWTTRYPALADTLIAVDYARYAAGMTLIESVEDGSPNSPEAAAAAALGREAVAALRAASAPKTPLTSLLSDAAARGMNAASLAQKLRLDRLLLGRLEQRLLDAATVPVSLVRQMAQILGRTPDDIAAYLRGGPRLAMKAQFRARQAPALRSSSAAENIGFADALQASHAMSEDDRAYWQDEINAGVLGTE